MHTHDAQHSLARRKPLVMLDALAKDAKILYQDAGQEFRRPIDEVLRLIARDGHFFVAQDGWHTKLQCCGRLLELCHQGTLDYLGRDRAALDAATMCAGGIQGYVRDGFAHNSVATRKRIGRRVTTARRRF